MKRNRHILPVSGNQDGKANSQRSAEGETRGSENQLALLVALTSIPSENAPRQPRPQLQNEAQENGSKKMAYDAELLPHDPGKRIPITMHSMNYQGALHRRSMLKGPCQPYHHYFLVSKA